jgi:hypothetical protein
LHHFIFLKRSMSFLYLEKLVIWTKSRHYTIMV